MLKNNTILVVVPARGGSKGIPLKNIYPLMDKPLLTYTADVIKQLDYIDRSVVSTDHEKIAAVAESCGISVPFYRPDSLSGDRIADWDVLHHALTEIEKLDGREYNIIVMLQPTSPLRKPDDVTKTIITLINGGFDAVWTVSPTDSKAHPLKQLVIENGTLDYYDQAGANIIARQQLKPVYHRNGVAYAIRRECLVKKQSIKGENTGAVIIENWVANIDTKMDILWTEFLLQHNKV